MPSAAPAARIAARTRAARPPPAAGARAPPGTGRSRAGGARTPGARDRSARRAGTRPRRPDAARDRSCHALHQLAPHLLEAEPHPSLDGAERLLDQLRDLALGVAAEVRQLDRLALLVRQSVQGSPHATRLLASRNLHVRPLARLVALLHDIERLARAVVDGAPPQPIDGSVVH